jgi:hypothetical protein
MNWFDFTDFLLMLVPAYAGVFIGKAAYHFTQHMGWRGFNLDD